MREGEQLPSWKSPRQNEDAEFFFLRIQDFGVPIVVQWKRIRLGTLRLWV